MQNFSIKYNNYFSCEKETLCLMVKRNLSPQPHLKLSIKILYCIKRRDNRQTYFFNDAGN